MIKRKYSTNHSRPFLISYMSIELKLMNGINKSKWKHNIMTQFMCFKVMLLKVPLKSVERKCTEKINEVHQRVYLENENRVNVQKLISPCSGLDLYPSADCIPWPGWSRTTQHFHPPGTQRVKSPTPLRWMWSRAAATAPLEHLKGSPETSDVPLGEYTATSPTVQTWSMSSVRAVQ